MFDLIRHCFVNLSFTTFTNLYKALIRPILEYGNTIWGPFYTCTSDINKPKNIQRKITSKKSNPEHDTPSKHP